MDACCGGRRLRVAETPETTGAAAGTHRLMSHTTERLRSHVHYIPCPAESLADPAVPDASSGRSSATRSTEPSPVAPERPAPPRPPPRQHRPSRAVTIVLTAAACDRCGVNATVSQALCTVTSSPGPGQRTSTALADARVSCIRFALSQLPNDFVPLNRHCTRLTQPAMR